MFCIIIFVYVKYCSFLILSRIFHLSYILFIVVFYAYSRILFCCFLSYLSLLFLFYFIFFLVFFYLLFGLKAHYSVQPIEGPIFSPNRVKTNRPMACFSFKLFRHQERPIVVPNCRPSFLFSLWKQQAPVASCFPGLFTCMACLPCMLVC